MSVLPERAHKGFYCTPFDNSKAGIFVMRGSRIKLKKGDVLSKCIYIGEHGIIGKKRFCVFKCSCGKEFVKRLDYLSGGVTTHCGCNDSKNKSDGQYKHGLSFSKSYHAWVGIKNRCYNPKNMRYKDYGARGIRVQSNWIDSPIKFCEYVDSLENRHKEGVLIDRIDNNIGYVEGNIRWATIEQSNNNRRNTKYVEYKNKKVPLRELMRDLNRPDDIRMIHERMNRGYSLEDALNKPRVKLWQKKQKL